MSFITNKRGRIAAIITGVIALTASVLTVAPAQAVTAAAVPVSWGNIDRDTSGGQFVLGASESIRFYTSADLDGGYFGDHPITGSTVFTAALPVMTLPTGVTAGSTSYMWNASGSGDCFTTMGNSASYTVTNTCTTYVSVSANTIYTNNTGADLTVTFDNSSAALVRDGVTTDGQSGSWSSQSATRSISQTSSFTIRGDGKDEYLSATFSACLTGARTADEHLTVSFDITIDGVTQTVFDGEDWSNGAVAGDIEAYMYGSPESSTSAFDYVVPTGSSSSTNISRRLGVSPPAGGSWSLAMSVKDSDGNLVAGTCSGGGGGMSPTTYPASVSAPTGAATLPFAQTSKTLASGVSSLTSATSTDDGSGGKLYAASASGTSVTVIDITPTGPKSTFAKTGKATISGIAGVNTLAVYNAKKNWAATSGNPMTGYKIHSGTFAASTVTTKSVTSANLAKACGGTGYSAAGFSVLNTAMTLPLASISCTKTSNMGSFTVLAKITPTSGAVTKITQLGNPGTGVSAACVVVSSGNNPNATGSAATYVAYVQTGTADGPCYMGLSTVSKREIVFVTAAGAASTKAVTGNPWGSTVADEPSRVYFAPGKAAGSWIGTGMIGGMMSPPTGTRLFTVSSAKAISAKGLIAIDDEALSALDYPSIYPVKEIGTGKWSLNVQTFGTTQEFAMATVVPSTGAVTLGEILTVTDTGSYSPRQIIDTTALSTDGKLRHYVLTSATAVTITTWTSPAS
jgi:hypothetical protein